MLLIESDFAQRFAQLREQTTDSVFLWKQNASNKSFCLWAECLWNVVKCEFDLLWFHFKIVVSDDLLTLKASNTDTQIRQVGLLQTVDMYFFQRDIIQHHKYLETFGLKWSRFRPSKTFYLGFFHFFFFLYKTEEGGILLR